jgi:hypothetical protein
MSSKILSTHSGSQTVRNIDLSQCQISRSRDREHSFGISLVGTAREPKDGEGAVASESWNKPVVNLYRLLSCFLAMMAMSITTSSLGVSEID